MPLNINAIYIIAILNQEGRNHHERFIGQRQPGSERLLEMKKILIVAMASLLGLTLSAEPEFQPRPPLVGVAEVTMVRDHNSRRYTGRIVSQSVIRIVPRVSGEILEVGFKDGDFVRKGQMLYRLDSVQYEAAVKNAEAKVAECKARLRYAQKNFDRNNLLYLKQAASLDAMENTKSASEAARAALLAAEAELIAAGDNLSRTVISAPDDGMAGVTNYTSGNYVTPESGTLVTLVRNRPIRVRFSISSADYLSQFGSVDAMKRDCVVKIRLADGTVYPENGTVELLNNEINARTDAVQVYARFENEDARLMSGGTVSVTLSRQSGTEHPAVAIAAVMHDAKGSYVYVVSRNNTVEKRYVELGNTTRDLQMIRKGLKPGERVIIKGTHKAVPGAAINPLG